MPVGFLVAVFGVSRQRVTDVGGMHADLVGAAGAQGGLHQPPLGVALDFLEEGQRRLAVRGGRDHPLAALQYRFAQRHVHAEARLGRMTHHQTQVLLGDLAGPDRRLQPGQPGTALGQHQDAAGVTVQPMHQFQRLARPCRPQQLDRPVAHAAAAMAGEPGRFVQHQEMPILEDHRCGHLLESGGGWRLQRRTLGDAHRRNTQSVAGGKAGIGLGAATVHPYLTRTQQPVDQAFRHALEQGRQGVVDALAFALGTDLQLAHPLRCRWGSCRLH
jgi:hypothetical protein